MGNSIRPIVLGIGIVFLLAGCVSDRGFQFAPSSNAPTSLALHDSIPENKVDTEVRQATAAGIKALDDGDYERANKAFNVALKLDITNSYLHFFNAYVYHLRAANGEVKNFALAEEGYRQALTFDPSNWMADYYLGLAYFDQRKFKLAQAQFARSAAHRDDDPDVLYDLAAASYYARDPRTADAALTRLRAIVPEDWRGGRVLGVSAMVKAALREPNEAETYLASYRQIDEDGNADVIERRLLNWQGAYKAAEAAGVQLAQMEMGTEADPMNEEFEEEFVDEQMAVVDVVIIRTEEDISTSKGVNLLSGLELQFGDPTVPTPGFSFSRNKVTDYADQDNNVNTRTVTRLISIPSVTYSLNIANALSDRNEILARPSLVAVADQTSEFFSGVEVAAAATSGGDGDSVSIEKEIGVRLAITPEFLPGDRVKLEVIAERTFLTTPSSSVVFEFRLDTSKTTVNANVAMKFGETLILSGLSERESENNRDGVPFLQDIPIVQYAFSRATTRNFRKSVLILLTPRRAQYINRSAEDRERAQALLSEFERSIAELEQRHGDWFQPSPPFQSIIDHMESNALYREFRTGDIPLERWNGRRTHEERLRSAVKFLYY